LSLLPGKPIGFQAIAPLKIHQLPLKRSVENF
jgi:hypothetical protein